MSQNLKDFFQANSKKNKKTKKNADASKAQAANAATPEEEVNAEATSTAAASQPEPQSSTAQDYADSSEDESNLVLASQEIIERKDLEAKNQKKKDETDGAAGWGLGAALGQAAATEQKEGPQDPSFSSSAKGAKPNSSISFGKKPPMFTRKQKGIMDQQDFPDLDSAADNTVSKNDSSQPKAAGPMMFSFGSAAKGPREAAAQEESKAGPKMPIFKGKGKLTTGDVTNEAPNTRQNYDFSRMGMSAATAGKRAEGDQKGPPRAEDGQPKSGGAANQGLGGFDGDDEFEVVKEKRTGAKRRQFEGESSFGGGKPTFTRGGK